MLSEYKRENRAAAANERGIAVDLFDTLDISKQKNTNTNFIPIFFAIQSK